MPTTGIQEGVTICTPESNLLHPSNICHLSGSKELFAMVALLQWKELVLSLPSESANHVSGYSRHKVFTQTGRPICLVGPIFTELLEAAWTLRLAKKLSSVGTMMASYKSGIPLALVVHMPFPWTKLICSAQALIASHTKRLSASVPSIETCIRYWEKVMPLSATRHQQQPTLAYPDQAVAFWSPGIVEVLTYIVRRLECEERSLYSPSL